MRAITEMLLLLLVVLLAPALGGVAGELSWKEINDTRIPIPPPEHPRLYFRAEHVQELPQRLAEPALAPARDRLEKLARGNKQFRVEWEAVQCLADPKREGARKIVEEALRLLQECELPDRNDACRYTGRMMVTGAIAYDWFYPILSKDEKAAFIKEQVRLAKTLECGYPPLRQGSVTGHSSEAMIMRDMMSAGIAVHDEFPEMYELAASRFYREHLPARNWLYDGHAYHQGDSYGPYRFGWDTLPL